MEAGKKLYLEVSFLPDMIILAQLQGCLVIHVDIASQS